VDDRRARHTVAGAQQIAALLIAGEQRLVGCVRATAGVRSPGSLGRFESGVVGVAQPGLQSVGDLYAEFVHNGGQVWLCGACAKTHALEGIGDGSGHDAGSPDNENEGCPAHR
jgi:hypothetical protein